MCSFDSLFRLREKVAELDWNDNGNVEHLSRDWTLIEMDLAMFSRAFLGSNFDLGHEIYPYHISVCDIDE